MIEEQGRIVELEGEFAWVETQRVSACASCSVNKGCGTGAISKYFGARFNRVKAINEIGAGADEMVVIGLEEQALVRGSLAVYVVPLVGMFVMAVVGEVVATKFALGDGDGFAVLAGLIGLAGGFAWVKGFSSRIAKNEQYQPVILRRVSGAACAKDVVVNFDD